MRSKAPLTLMEQVVMILVFAMSAALCIQVLVFAGGLSRRNEARDRAVLEAQSTAETLKAVGRAGGDSEHVLDGAARLLRGRTESGVLYLDYDADWLPTEEPSAVRYRLCAEAVPMEMKGLAGAEIRVMPADEPEAEYIRLRVAWQEVAHG